MANVRNVYQQTNSLSIPREEFLDNIVFEEELTKTDLRVCLFLLSELNGWSPPKTTDGMDPLNFKKIDSKHIAEKLYINKKDVKRSIKNLELMGIIEKGDSNTARNGYRFTF